MTGPEFLLGGMAQLWAISPASLPSGLEGWVQWLTSQGSVVALSVLLVASVVEYVFPPFPGDTVTLAGAVLSVRGGWSVWYVLVAVTLGSLVGAWLDYRLGLAAGRRRKRKRSVADIGGEPGAMADAAAGVVHTRYGAESRAGWDRVMAGYRRWGAAFLAVNRFLPGVRPLFFVAAGAAGMKTLPVLFWAGVSALAWNGLILSLGVQLGTRLPLLEEHLRSWSVGSLWVLAGVLVVVLVTAAVVARLRKRPRQS